MNKQLKVWILIIVAVVTAVAVFCLKPVSVIVWYAMAKVLEVSDKQIFSLDGGISGHALKQVSAGVSTAYLVEMFKERYSYLERTAKQVCHKGSFSYNLIL